MSDIAWLIVVLGIADVALLLAIFWPKSRKDQDRADS